MRILLVEDDPRIANLLRRGLARRDHATDLAATGAEALGMAESVEYDAIVLELVLPDRDGFAICAGLRAAHVWAPVLMLTARDAVDDRVGGLDGGADDYLLKPFSFAELEARLRGLVRDAPDRPLVLAAGDLRLDPATRRVARAKTEIELSRKEFDLLEMLLRRAGQVVSRYELLEHGWDFAYVNRSNAVDVYIRRLRDKVDRPFGRHSVETVQGVGYRLREDGC